MKVTTIRNVMVIVLLWVGGALMAPARLSATCYPPEHEDYFNMAGYCTNDGTDACTAAHQYCDYYCFTQWSGDLCWDNMDFCSQENQGSEEFPNYCVTGGYCRCFLE